MKKTLLISLPLLLIVWFWGCEDEPDPKDCAGIAGGVASEDECGMCTGGTTGLIANYLQDCAGVCSGNSQLDCDDNCRSASYYDNLGDGYCDTVIPVLDCAEYNCDDGDCGTWNGSYCKGYDGISAIQWDYMGDVSYVYGTDPSMPQIFYWNNYYASIIGTYYFEYLGNYEQYYYYGYYTTYNSLGSANTNGDLLCFELFMFSLIGPAFYEWNLFDTDCYNYFDGLLGKMEIPFKEPNVNSDEYDNYLTEITRYNNNKSLEQIQLGESSLEKIRLTTFTQISNSQHDLRIDNIDSHPDVVVQQGKSYIMKYIRKEISP